MNKLFLLIGLVVLVSGSVFAKTTEWKETRTTFTQFLQMKEYKIVEVSYEPSLITYHIRGLKEFIICQVKLNINKAPKSTTCYYENWLN